MLSIANEVDPLIFHCVCFVRNTNHVFPTPICLVQVESTTHPFTLETKCASNTIAVMTFLVSTTFALFNVEPLLLLLFLKLPFTLQIAA